MKKTSKWLYPIVFILFSLIIFSSLSFSSKNSNEEGIVFFTGTWKETLEKAQKENKPVFVDIYAKWCGPCKLLKKNAFTDKEVATFYNNHFINVSLDGEQGEGAQIAAQLGVSAYPTLFYFDKNGKPVLYSLGYLQPSELIGAGKAALEKIK